MTQDRTTRLFFEMFDGLPRQGPGDTASTLKALALVPHVGPSTRVLDLGCGTGFQTLILARSSPAHFVALDTHPPYIEALNLEARRLGIADRIDARVGDMRHLEFAPGSFDLIWCEGAIYNVGLDAGLRAWRRLIAPNGHVAVTEVCWARPDPPAECAAFWAKEYPAIREPRVHLATIGECGYDPIGHFALPPSSWWDDYYRPLQTNVTAFRGRHPDEADAQELADQVQREIDIWHGYSEFYSYDFFVMRAR